MKWEDRNVKTTKKNHLPHESFSCLWSNALGLYITKRKYWKVMLPFRPNVSIIKVLGCFSFGDLTVTWQWPATLTRKPAVYTLHTNRRVWSQVFFKGTHAEQKLVCDVMSQLTKFKTIQAVKRAKNCAHLMLKPRIVKCSILRIVAGKTWSSVLWSSMNDSRDKSLSTSDEIQGSNKGWDIFVTGRAGKRTRDRKTEYKCLLKYLIKVKGKSNVTKLFD